MRSGLAGMLILGSFLLFLNSCKDDPAPIAGISFDIENEETTESDGTIKSFHPLLWQNYAYAIGSTGTATGREFKVKLVLDRPAPDVAVVSFSLSGTAIKNSASAIGDFSVDNTNVTIDKGATEVYIPLTLYEDFSFFEFDTNYDLFKTIIITLESVISGPVTISDTKKVYTLTINEDDLLAILEWNADDGGNAVTTALDVDMDMLLWSGSTRTPIKSDNPKMASEYDDKIGIEGFSIPGGFPSAIYGLSHVYYSGTADPLDFYVFFFGKVGTTNYTFDQPLVFRPNPKYMLSNKNKYDDIAIGKTPLIVQTIVKNGLNFTNISSISVPSSGSRVGDLTNVWTKEKIKTNRKIMPIQNINNLKRQHNPG